MLIIPALCLSVIFNPWISEATDYCAVDSCGKGHTMCQYPNSGPSSNCDKYEPAALTSSEKSALVDRHNLFRKKVADGSEKRGNPGPQPAATDMNMLQWDDELASIAQRWADQCLPGHDSCRDVARFVVGQNIATSWSTAKITRKVESLVDDWYNEVRFFKKYNVASFKADKSWGHYSQLVWAKTMYIGCARILFWDGSRRMNTLRLVCNYGPAGNYRDQPVYTAAATSLTRRFFICAIALCSSNIFLYLMA